jgi:hypothetical protein
MRRFEVVIGTSYGKTLVCVAYSRKGGDAEGRLLARVAKGPACDRIDQTDRARPRTHRHPPARAGAGVALAALPGRRGRQLDPDLCRWAGGAARHPDRRRRGRREGRGGRRIRRRVSADRARPCRAVARRRCADGRDRPVGAGRRARRRARPRAVAPRDGRGQPTGSAPCRAGVQRRQSTDAGAAEKHRGRYVHRRLGAAGRVRPAAAARADGSRPGSAAYGRRSRRRRTGARVRVIHADAGLRYWRRAARSQCAGRPRPSRARAA